MTVARRKTESPPATDNTKKLTEDSDEIKPTTAGTNTSTGSSSFSSASSSSNWVRDSRDVYGKAKDYLSQKSATMLNKQPKRMKLLAYGLVILIVGCIGFVLAFDEAMDDAVHATTRSYSRMKPEYHYDEEFSDGREVAQPLVSAAMTSRAYKTRAKKMLHREDNELGQDFVDEMEQSMQNVRDSSNDIHGPMLIHSGNIQVGIKPPNMNAFQDKLDNIVKDVGNGYFEDKSRYNMGDEFESMTFTVRVESKKFHHVIEEIKKAADKVDSLHMNSRDVTSDYVDSKARADVMAASRTALQSLLGKAENVEEIVMLQKELNRLMATEESLRQHAKQLKQESDYSRLTININNLGNEVGFEVSDIFEPIFEALEDMIQFFAGIIAFCMYMSVWCCPVATFFIIYFKVWKGKEINIISSKAGKTMMTTSTGAGAATTSSSSSSTVGGSV